MSALDQDSRMAQALSAARPAEALLELARALRDEGMSQKEMYGLFDRHRAQHENDADETAYDAILDTMDFIGGWCSASLALFDTKPS